MTTIELEAYKAELAREVLNIDSREVLDAVKRTMQRVMKKKTFLSTIEDASVSRTIEEVKKALCESEADEKAGRTYTCNEAHGIIENEFLWLRK